MDLSGIRDEVRFITRTDTTSFGNTDINREANIAYRKLMMEILLVQGYRNVSGKHVTTDLISTSGLVAGNIGYGGEYPFPTDLIRPHRIEVKYSSTGAFVPCEIVDMQDIDYPLADVEEINDIANEDAPIVRVYHNSYFLAPVKTTTGSVTAGIHIWYEERESELSADSDEPQFEVTFHDLIPLMVASRFYLRHPSKRNVQVLNELNMLMRQFRAHYRKMINVRLQLKPRTENFA